MGKAEKMVKTVTKDMAMQRERFEIQLGQLKTSQDFVEESRCTCSQREILWRKNSLVKQMNDLKGSIKQECFAVAEQANLEFSHSLSELVKTFQQFGKVYCHPVCPEKCQASREGIKVATKRENGHYLCRGLG